MMGILALLFLGFVILVLVILVCNKKIYGGWLLFPWSRNNPYNVILREVDKVQQDLKKLGEDLESGDLAGGEFTKRMHSIGQEMDRLDNLNLRIWATRVKKE